MAAPDASRADAMERASDDRSLGDLFGTLAEDMGTLVRKELELARIELRDEVDASKRAGAMLGATALTGYLAVLLLSFAAAWGLAEAMPEGVAFLIVGAVYAVIAAVAWSRTRTQLRRVRPVPQQTIDTVKEDMQWAKQQLR